MQLITKIGLILLLFSGDAVSQDSISIAPGEEYNKSFIHKLFWGKNRRKEWTTSVRVPVIKLDSIYGGLKPYKKGGGNESRSLRLRSASGKEYTIRSVNKSRDAVIPKLLKNSYFGAVIQDGVSMSYPYGSLAAYGMMTSSNIYHPKPMLVYIPKQSALDSFNSDFADDLYTLEERPDGDWSSGADHLGAFDKFFSSEEVIDKVYADHQFKIDQYTFIKARLFDILIGDWDRNGGNWVWGMKDNHFIPIAKDRDQAFYTTDGFLMKLFTRMSRNGYMQNFSNSISNISRLTKQDRAVDNIFTSEMSLNDWLKAATELQQSLTDEAIVASISNLPREIFAISGNELISKLKQRRDKLQEYAASFYKVLAKEVKITATKENDRVKVSQLTDGSVSIEIFNSIDLSTPYYHRIFLPEQTKSISINGFGGDDVFDIDPTIKTIKITSRSLVEPVPGLAKSK